MMFQVDTFLCALFQVEVPKVLKPRSFPHYMEKKNSFISKSILGEIYDRVTEYQAEDNLSKGDLIFMN